MPQLSSDKDESYWLGVRDALRMIDSFVAWSRRNPARAKKIGDFIDDALIAVNHHCKSCLSEALGISFGESRGEEAVLDLGDRRGSPVPGARSEAPAAPSSVFSAEYPSDLAEPAEEETLAPPELPEEERDEASYSEPPLSEMPDMSRMGSATEEGSSHEEASGEKPRDFPSEFPLTEPTSLETESSLREEQKHLPSVEGPLPVGESSVEPVRTQEEKAKEPADAGLPEAWADFEDSLFEHGIDIGLPKDHEESEPDIGWDKAEGAAEKASEGFSWEEYERTISSPPQPEEPKAPTGLPESQGGKSAPAWSPFDEPVEVESKVIEHGPAEPEEETEEEESEEDATRPAVRPPPPPPRPESEESEEERKKRARRLFFGT